MNELLSQLYLVVNDPLLFFVIIFFLMLFAGEPIVLGVSFISSSLHLLSFTQLLIIAYCSSLIGELFWFSLGRSQTMRSFDIRKYIPALAADVSTFTQKIKMDSPFRQLFYSRFVSGLAIFVILMIGRSGLPLKTFLRYIVVVNAFWTLLIVSLGYLAAKGYSIALTIFTDIKLVFGVCLILLFCLYFLFRYYAQKSMQS